MQTRMESNGDIVVPGKLGQELGFRPGDTFDLSVEAGRIVVAPQRPQKQYVGTIIEDPITGLPVIDFGPDAPIITHEQIQELLVEFP
jgi:bifunctional DNA-binding transcriptional regulator/antitoxin component of YhaV-PrlF toxin-antitoxin module